MTTEKWVAKDGAVTKSLQCRPVEWDTEGNPTMFEVWPANCPEPDSNPFTFGIEALRITHEREMDKLKGKP